MKRMFSALLAAVMLICLLPAGALALRGNTANVTVDENAELVASGSDVVVSPTSAGSTPITVDNSSKIVVESGKTLSVNEDCSIDEITVKGILAGGSALYCNIMNVDWGAVISTGLTGVTTLNYQVKYDPNGAGVTGMPAAGEYKESGVAGPLSAARPVRANYTFLGWALAANATAATYQPGANVTLSAPLLLYAVWQAVAPPPGTSYTVTYNGGAGSTLTVSADVVAAGTSVKLPAATGAKSVTRAGYRLLGWATKTNAATAAYAAGGTYVPTANITLYAVWNPTIKLTYYSSIAGASLPGPQTVDAGASVKLEYASLGGYNLKGYATASDAKTVKYTAGKTYAFSADTTLYALWEYTGHYTVTYDANGGAGAPSATSHTYGQAVTVNFTTIPVRPGYTFLGWSTSSTATTAAYTSGGTKSFTMGASNVTLYAVWSYTGSTTASNPSGNIWINDVAAGSTLTTTALSSGSSSYKALKKAAGSGATVLCAYDIKLSTSFTGTKQLVFNFGSAYANRNMTVLHLRTSSKIDYYNVATDGNGYLTVNVSTLSPFMVLSGTITGITSDIPQTADENNVPVWGILMAIMLCLAAIAALYGTLAYGKKKDV